MLEKPQLFKIVDFDLPFILFLKDSLNDPALRAWAEACSAGRKPLPYSQYAPASEKPSQTILLGALPVHVPPDHFADWYKVSLPEQIVVVRLARPKPYEVSIPEQTVHIRLLRRVNPHHDVVFIGEAPGDRNGQTSFSSVRVIFEVATISSEHHLNFPLFCELAIAAINHFISHYRVIANRPYVSSVTMSAIHSFAVTTEFEDGTTLTQTYRQSCGDMHGMGGSIPDDQDCALRTAVAIADPPSIEKTLDVNIRDYLDLHEWRLAVIESAVAFEAWIAKFLRSAFVDARLTDAEINQKFLNGRGLPRSVTSIAEKLVKEATGYNFGETPEYSEWAKNVVAIRNDIVHGKRFDITKVEAFRAYAAMKKAIAVIVAHHERDNPA